MSLSGLFPLHDFMRWILSTWVLLVLVACSSAPTTSSTTSRVLETTSEAADSQGQVPLAQIQMIPSRSRLLKKGMSEEQVFRTLGLYNIVLSGNASGPPGRSVR